MCTYPMPPLSQIRVKKISQGTSSAACVQYRGERVLMLWTLKSQPGLSDEGSWSQSRTWQPHLAGIAAETDWVNIIHLLTADCEDCEVQPTHGRLGA